MQAVLSNQTVGIPGTTHFIGLACRIMAGGCVGTSEIREPKN